MSRSTCAARSWNLLIQSRSRCSVSGRTIPLIAYSIPTRHEINSVPREYRSFVRNFEIFAKLARTKSKRQKRAHDATDIAAPVQLPQLANAPDVTMGDTHNEQGRRPSWPDKVLQFNGSTGNLNFPSQNAVFQGIEDPTVQGNSKLPQWPGSTNIPDTYAPIPKFNNPTGENGYGGEQLSSVNMPTSPSSAFGAFNVPTWPVNMNSPPMTTPQLQSPFPFFNPMFFNQNSMGTMPPFPMMPPFNSMFPMQTQNMSTMAGSTRDMSNMGLPRRARSPTPPMKKPSPTKEYMLQASKLPQKSPSKRPLLIILDLNGTLIFRKHRKLPPVFARRHGLDEFLDILTSKYAVMIWTSSKPPTLNAVCNKLFPGEKRKGMIALWGRDKFGLTKTQYNAKLQVYKELRKVWASPELQAAYPGNEAIKPAAPPKRAGGKHSKKNQMRQQAGTFSPGQRWDQTNTILIDDSKLKALSEPFNILEIPEFTNDPNIDESNLFTQVLAKLDALSRYNDVSQVLRQWNECVAQGEASILDLELEPEEDSDSDEDGGMTLAPASTPGTSANPIDPDAVSTTAEMDRTEAKRRRNEHRKIRKKEKKAAKAAIAAANQLAQQSQTKAQPKAQASGSKNADTPNGRKAAKMSRRKKGKNKPVWAQEPDVERELEPNAQANIIEKTDGKRYNFHQKVQSDNWATTDSWEPTNASATTNARETTEPADWDEEPPYEPPESFPGYNNEQRSFRPNIAPGYTVEPSPTARVLDRAWEEYHRSESLESNQGPIPQLQQHDRPYFQANPSDRPVSPVTDDRRRSASPATSGNSLLDKLEEGLGFPNKR